MRKFVFFLLFAAMAVTAMSQDTLFFKNGNVELVKILDMNKDNISYKQWSNIDGPTLVKSLGNFVSVKKGKNNYESTISFDFSKCDAPQSLKKKKNKKKKCISGNDVAAYIDSLYTSQPASAEILIPKYLETLPQCVNLTCIGQCYLDLFNNACDAKNSEDIAKYGEIYLCLGMEKELPSVITVLARVFASEGQETKTQDLIKKFEAFDSTNDNFFSEDIEELKKETHELLHPKRLVDDYMGMWVRIDEPLTPSFNTHFTPMILTIKEISDTGSCAIFLDKNHYANFEKKDSINTMYVNKKINISKGDSGIAFNGVERFLAIQFSNEYIRDRSWLDGVASIGSETARQMGADVNATIWTSKDLTNGEKFTTSLLSSLLVEGFIDIISSANYSYRQLLSYKFILWPPYKNGIMEVEASKFDKKVDNNGQIFEGENYTAKKMEFARWDESDSVYFVSVNGKPITLYPYKDNDPSLKEYYDIKNTYSLRNKAYLLPFLGCNALSSYLFFRSIFIFEDSYLMNGHYYVLDENGNKKHDKGKVIKGSLFIGTSILGFIIANAVIFSNMSSSRNKAFFSVNQKSLNKLQNKRGSSLSFSPMYDPINNAFGATANIKF